MTCRGVEDQKELSMVFEFDDGLAILNLQRRILDGPEYLDHLFDTNAHNGAALKYLGKDNHFLTLSYLELDSLSEVIAQELEEHSHTLPNQNIIVPVILPQHPALYISYLGILKCGAAFCPILPDTPGERLKFILKDIDATVGFCSPSQRESLSSLSSRVKWIAVDWSRLLASQTQTQQSVVKKRFPRKTTDIAYVMYTSGSTGQPKGVSISHHAVTQSLLAHDEHIPRFERFLQFAAPTFDVSIFEIFFPFFRGATLVCCERDRMLVDLPGVIKQCEIDACELTPTVTRTLLRNRAVVPDLKVLLTIGEMLNDQTIKEFGGDDNQQSVLFAMYGPTEAAIHCTIVPRMASTSSVRNIGKPLSTVTSFILNRSNTIVKKGEIGELAIAGQLAEGYLHRDEATRASFVEVAGYGRVYKTGDMAMMTNNDDLQIYGRISKGQVKIRGQRIELGEIEQAACRHDGVELAVALVAHESIILFCSGSSELSSQGVELACKSWLPRHMLPSDIMILPQGLPQLPSGKVDRTRLENIYEDQQVLEEKKEQSSKTEEDLHASIYSLISQELGVAVHAQSPLQKNGLDSLRAIRISSKLRRNYPSATVSAVLDADTVPQLISSLSGRDFGIEHSADTSLPYEQSSGWCEIVADALHEIEEMQVGVQVEEVLPCSAIQVAMLAETVFDSRINFNTIHLSLNECHTFNQFMQAFSILANRNSILRSGFLATRKSDVLYIRVVKAVPSFEQEPDLFSPIWIRQGSDSSTIAVTIHHAVYDGWSWDIMMYELNRILSGLSVTNRPSFHELVKQERSIISTDADSQLTAWADQLKDFIPVQFPVLRAGVVTESGRGQHKSRLDASLTAISELARAKKVNNASIVHTALLILLSQLLDSTGVACGLVLAGRDRALVEVEEVIGPCLTTLPVYVDTSVSETVGSLIGQVYQQYMHCLRCSAVSLAQIGSALKMETAAFDVVFVWQQSLYSDCSQDRVRTVSSKDNLRYSLLVEVELVADQVEIKTTYDISKLDSVSVRTLHAQLNTILNSIIHRPSQPLDTLVSELNQDLLAVVLAKTEDNGTSNLTSTIARLAQQDPERIAVEFVTEAEDTPCSYDRATLSFKDLNYRSEQMANMLRSHYTMQPNETIVVCCEKSIDVYTVICAAVRAGVAYLCIDIRTPILRIVEIIRQVNARIILVDQLIDSREWDPNFVLEMTLGDFCKQSQERLWQEHDIESSPADLAYTVFTSGSTGVPKGVLVTRGNLMSNIQALTAIYPHQRSSKLLQSCSLAFDVSVFEIFWTWHCGLSLCASSNDVLFRNIEDFIRINSITHLSMTPSVAALVQPGNVPNVQFLVCSGEPMSRKVFESWADHGLHQGYGPSETTNICNVIDYRKGRRHINNVGPAFPNTSIYVCRRLPHDRKNSTLERSDFRLQAKGAVGEIWIGGAQVGKGYTDDILTSKSWLEHPKFGILYRSGDIGRLLADNSLVVIGRDDDQAKMRGLRIELNEINTRLMQIENVHDCYTVILRDNEGEKLITFWVAKSDVQDDRSAIRELYDNLSEALPYYMIPAFLIPTCALPLTRQGKVDRQALHSIYKNLKTAEREQFSNLITTGKQNAEESELHSIIRNALSQLTGVPIMDLNDYASFPTYGIDSVRAISFARNIQKSTSSHLAISDILRYSSVERLATHLNNKQTQANGFHKLRAVNMVPMRLYKDLEATCRSRGVRLSKVLPCSPLQQAMLLSSDRTGEDGYVNHLTYRIRQTHGKLKPAWAAVVRRHDILRTIFALTNDQDYPVVQGVLDDFDLPWLETSTPPSNIGLRPFDGLTYKLYLERQASGERFLHVLMHHALYDAEAVNNIQLEIEIFCTGQPLPEPVPFSKYLDHIFNIDARSAHQFWSKHLKDVKPTRFAISKHPVSDGRIITRRKKCSSRYSELLAYARQASTTLLSLFQALVAQFLSGIFQEQDICFGTVYSGRTGDITDAEKIVGPCFNTLPTRLITNSRSTITSLYRYLQEFNSAILDFQGTALRDLQSIYAPDGQRLFDTILLLQSLPHRLNNDFWILEGETGQMGFPLIIEIQPDSQTDDIEILIHSSVFGANILDTAISDLLELLQEIVRNPSVSLHDSSLQSIGRNSCSAFRHIVSRVNVDSSNDEDNWSPSTDNDTTLSVRELITASVKALSKKKLHTVPLTSDIYRIGLDSISAAQLAHRLKSAGYEVTTADILGSPKISSIIELCTSMHKSTVRTDLDTNEIVEAFDRKHRDSVLRQLNYATQDVEAVWPCTSTQLGILSEFSKSGGEFYYNTIRLFLGEETQKEPLFRAWREVALRHTMLRTGFIEVDDGVSPFAMIVYATDSPRCQPQNWFQKSDHETRKDHSNIETPPWTLRYIETEDSRIIEWEILHALYDAQSLQSILADVTALYHNKELQRITDIRKSLGRILEGNRSPVPADSYFIQLQQIAQPTKFPDLNIKYRVTSKLNSCQLQSTIEVSRIQKCCEELSCTVSIACQAAWAQVLASYTGQQNVIFGNILSSRFTDEVSSGVVFPCINTLPVIVDVTSEMSLIKQISRINTEFHRNINLPVAKIQQCLGMEGELFDTVFAFQQATMNPNTGNLWSATDEASAEYAISLEVIAEGNHLVLQLTCNQRCIPREHMSILLEQYEQSLHRVLDIEDRRGSLVRHQFSISKPRCEFIPTTSMALHELFLVSLERHPHKVALEYVKEFNGTQVIKQTWSYSEIASRATIVANLLTNAGVSPGDLVAICFEKCPEASIALLGILMLGCAYVAIDPGAPASRQGFILEDAGCSALLTMSVMIDSFQAISELSIIGLDNLLNAPLPSKSLVELNRPGPVDRVCYCLYTSGTTGTPKGCLISHRSAVQAMLSFSRIFRGRWNAESRWLQFAAYHFDVSVLEHFWTWQEGLCVTVVPRDLLFDDLPGTIDRLGITHLDLTPSLARLLTPENVPSLRKGVFIVGGEQVGQDIVDTWGDAQCLYNFYGPSEVTIGCTVHPQVAKNVRATNIGCTWDNVGAYVLQPGSENIVIIGGVGELCLSGPLVGIGYLNRQELTAKKFVRLENGDRIYRTGDLVRMLHDGSFDFLGRIDDQVKLRGQRLEIGEINSVLTSGSKRFSDAVSLILSHPEQSKEIIVGFLALEKAKRIASRQLTVNADDVSRRSIEDVRRHAVENLPGYMIPTFLLAIDFIPLTANNKIDHKSLKTLYEALPLQDVRKYQEPTEKSEKVDKESQHLRHIICQYLELPDSEVDMDTSLIQLGIDSIAAIRLSRQLRSHGYTAASVANLMRHPVIGSLCDILSRQSTRQSSEQESNIDAAKNKIKQFATKHRSYIARSLAHLSGEIEHIAPCSALQQGMISHVVGSRLSRPPYMTEWVYTLAPDTDLARLQEAWIRAAHYLDILRTYFISTDDGYAQVVMKDPHAPVNLYTKAMTTDGRYEAAESDQFEDWIRSVRDLEVRLPWSVTLLSSQQSRSSKMYLYIFHGLYDGISLPLLLDCVMNFYHSGESGFGKFPKFYDSLAYGPLAVYNDNDDLFWASNLKQVRLLGLQINNVPESSAPVLVTRIIHAPDVQKLCKDLSVTTQAVFHATWLMVLAQTFQLNPAIGVVFSGRLIELEHANMVIGPLFNTLPVRIDSLKADAKFHDLVKACHNKLAEILPHQHSTLSDIRKTTKSPRAGELFDSLFVYQGEPENTHHEHKPLWTEEKSESNIDFPLNFEVQPLSQNTYQLKIAAKTVTNADLDIDRLMDSAEEKLQRISKSFKTGIPPVFWTDLHPESHVVRATGDHERPTDDISDFAEAKAIREVLIDLVGDEVDIKDHSPNIFELGLDSLDAIKIAARLKKHGIILPVSQILRNPTVAGMANQWSMSRRITNQVNGVAKRDWYILLDRNEAERENFEIVMPVTNMQEGLLLDFEQYYNLLVYQLPKWVQLERLVSILHSTVEDLSVFRTRFSMLEARVDGTSYVQTVTKANATDSYQIITTHDLHNIDDLKRYVHSLRREVASQSKASDISLVRLDDGGMYLVLGLTHALYDGWSLSLLLHHMEESYHGRKLPTPQSGNVVDFVARTKEASINKSSNQFWSGLLKDINPTILAKNAGGKDAIFRQSVSRVDTAKLRQICQTIGITMQSVTLAVWHIALVYLTKKYDINFGLVLSGRDSEEAESLIFPTFNTVIFREVSSAGADKSEFLRKIHQKLIEIYEYQHYPLSESLRIARKGQDAIFDSLFTFQKTPELRQDGSPMFVPVDLGRESISPPYPVNVEAEEEGNSLVWTVATQSGVMHSEAATEILEMLDKIIIFLVDEETHTVFEGSDEALRVCGLPPIRMCHTSDYQEPQRQTLTNGTGEEEFSETELIVRDVLAKISEIDAEDIAKYTSIFSLGLDSISAIRISKMLRDRSMTIPVSMILKKQNVAEIAASMTAINEAQSRRVIEFDTNLVDKATTNAVLARLAGSGISDDMVESILPASGGQVYMLDMWQASGKQLMYGTFWLKIQNCDANKFEKAFSELIKDTPILRTQFLLHNEQYFQIVLSSTSGGVGPLQYRCSQRGDGLIFTLHIHHALYDALSLNLMLQELQRLYTITDSAKSISTGANDFLRSTLFDTKKAREFWRAYLKNVEAIGLSGSLESLRSSKYEPRIATMPNFRHVTRRAGISIQAILFAAVAHVYSEMGQKSSNIDRYIAIGVYLGSRSLDIDGITELAAPTFNIVPLKVKVGAGSSIIDMAKQIQEDLQEIALAERCGRSLREINRWTGIKINCVINFLKLPSADPSTDPLGVSRFEETTTIEHATGEAREIAQQLGDIEQKSPFVQEPKADGLEWCLPTLDVEAKVDEDGQLAVGLFAPVDMFDEERLKGIIGDLRKILNGVSGNDGIEA